MNNTSENMELQNNGNGRNGKDKDKDKGNGKGKGKNVKKQRPTFYQLRILLAYGFKLTLNMVKEQDILIPAPMTDNTKPAKKFRLKQKQKHIKSLSVNNACAACETDFSPDKEIFRRRAVACQTGSVRQGKATQYGGKYGRKTYAHYLRIGS